jgi:hypothetical protein
VREGSIEDEIYEELISKGMENENSWYLRRGAKQGVVFYMR